MKKIFFAMLMLPCLISCTNEKEQELIAEDEVKSTQIRSIEEAKVIAINAIDILNGKEARSVARKLDMNNIQYVTSVMSRNGQNINDTLIYVLNYADNAGFAIVSALKETEGLLAVTEEGSYNPNDEIIQGNEGFEMFMDVAEKYLESVRSMRIPTLPEVPGSYDIEIREDTLSTTRVEPLVNVRWGQKDYEGAYATNGIAGCANVAMAQIMTYFCYPNQISINYPNSSINSLTLNWNEIKKHNIKHAIQNCTANNAAHEAIGHLHRQLGHLNSSNYNATSTGTSPSAVPGTFRQLGYTISNYKNYNVDYLCEDLSANKLIFMIGYGYDAIANEITGGHAWVNDGYVIYQIEESEWTKPTMLMDWTFVRKYDPYDRTYLHMNWGGSGNCNGYFLANVLMPGTSIEFDNLGNGFSNMSGWNFDYNAQYITISR